MKVVFDLESDGLLPELTKIHCIGHYDLDERSGVVNLVHTAQDIEETIRMIQGADEIIGHNIIAFDIPALQKVYPWFKPTGKITDTLVISRLVAADLINDDANSVSLPEGFPKRLWGSHSLRAWGLRMGTMKGDYDGGWEECNQEMLDYCIQDVNVTSSLYSYLMVKAADFSERSLDLEHELAEICFRIGNNGWTFDRDGANDLYAELAKLRIQLEKDLQELFEPWEVHQVFIPKVNNKARGYVKGEPFTKVSVVEFNPNSRKHIHRCLVDKYGWKPKQFTPSGEAKVDEQVLSQLPYPEAQKLAKFFLVQKRIAQLAEGSQAWMKKVDSDGKIRHTIISGGTVSGRAAHRSPNAANVPSTRSAFGKQCRDLWTVPKGWTLCGADLSGLELRCLAHYLEDDGEYAKQILESDIHTFNQNAAGLATRDEAKRFIYSLLFGAGDKLIGEIVGGNSKDGKRLKAAFDYNVPAFVRLKKELQQAFKRGYLKGLDGRKLFVRSEHRCLSQLLQSSGAVLCKQWLALIDKEITKQGLEAYIVGWVHDEVQIACKTKEIANDVGNITRRMAKEAGEAFQFNLSVEAEFNLGRTWSDTH